RPDLPPVEAPIGQPTPRPATARPNPPDDALEIVGDIQRPIRTPGGVVRRRLGVEQRRRTTRTGRSGRAGREICEGRVAAEATVAGIEQERAGRPGAEEDESPARVGGGDLDPVRGGEVLAGDRPRAKEGSTA